MEIIIIAAITRNRALGKDNKIIWHLPDDFKHFKKHTSGNFILMGRKTFESFPKPLPNRTHLVITREKEVKNSENTLYFNSIQDALTYAEEQKKDKIYVIGGGEIYKQTLDIADKIKLTEIDTEVEADTFFPLINHEIWKETNRIHHPKDENHSYNFDFVTYIKK